MTPDAGAEAPRFLADAMLGKLAHWLVLLGYDASYAKEGRSDLELLEEAHREGRIFLTRDTKIPDVAGLRKIVIREQRFESQLAQVARELGLVFERGRAFSRCAYCNAALEALPREEALPLVPPLVRELDTPFWRCPACRRVYWLGTHTERMLKKAGKLFGGGGGAGGGGGGAGAGGTKRERESLWSGKPIVL